MNRKAALGLSVVLSLISIFLVLNFFISSAAALGGESSKPLNLFNIGDDGSRHFEPEFDQEEGTEAIPVGVQLPEVEVETSNVSEYLTLEDLQSGEPDEAQRTRWQYITYKANTNQRAYISLPRSFDKNVYTKWSPPVYDDSSFGRLNSQPLPNSINAAYSITLQTIHQNSDGDGYSSAFVFTNTGTSASDYYLDFYWPNGMFENHNGPYTLASGESRSIDMQSDNPVGRGYFVGWVVISSDEPIEGEITTPEYAYFSGFVYETDATTPITNVWVEVQGSDNQHYFGGNNTLSDGSFYVGGLAGGDYLFTAHPNYPWAKQWYYLQSENQSADPVSISAGGYIAGIDFALEPGGIITGYVFSDNGTTPLENINVDLDQGNYGTCSDEEGYYQIEAVPYGDNTIVAGRSWNWCTQQNSIYIQEYYSETPNFYDATPINISGGNDIVSNINFTLDVGGIITGRVMAEVGGAPLENVQVGASEYDEENYWSNSWTDSDGYYTIGGLVDGDYRVRIDNTDGGIPEGFAGEFYNNTYQYDEADRITISGGNSVVDIDFELSPGGTITGVIVDQNSGLPIPNTNVDMHDDDQGFGFGNCTDSNGIYQAVGLPYGDYIVESGGNWNYCQDQPSQYAHQYYDHKQYYIDADIVGINDSFTTATDINFSLETGSYITGTVVDESQGNAPVVDLRVEAQTSTGDCPWCTDMVADARTDSGGNYILGPLVEGEYAVYACTDCDNFLLVNEYYNDAYNFDNADFVSVTSGVTVTGINMYLGPGVFITGTVTVPSGYSQEGIQIDVNCWDGLDWWTGRQTDENGFYIVPVPPSYDSRWEVSARPWGTDLGFQWAAEFDLSQHTNWDFDLGPGGMITGFITNNGSPVDEVHVYAESNWMHNGANTDNQGYFELTNLPPGEYRVGADGNWMGYKDTYFGGHDWEWASVLNLEEGETIGGINFEIPELGRLEGHVYASDGVTTLEGVQVTAINDDGFWMGWSQFDGYFQIDLPAGDHKVRFGMEDWSMEPAYYPDSARLRDAVTVTVPTVDDSLYISETLENWATLSGKITDADTGDPIGGIHVGVMNVDKWSSDGACTDENGEYHIGQFWHGGDVIVTAEGTCGAYEYETVTTTFATAPGVDYTWNLSMTAGTLSELPFTIKANHIFGVTPIGSGSGSRLSDIDQILPALFTPIAQLDDKGEWYSDLLTQIPTEGNGGLAIINDQMVVTYTLKSGLFWSDGEALTSEDIRFAWKIYTQPHPFADAYQVNWSEMGHLESIFTPDSLTAVLTFTPGFYSPSYPGTILYPLPEHVLAGEHPMDIQITSEFNHFPVGNGPYVVEDWVPRSHIDLRPNPNYHKRGSGYPKIEEVRILFNGHPFWSLVTGVADVSLNTDTNNLPDDPESFGVELYPSSNLGFDNIYLNPNTPFFSETEVRKALYYALDTASFVRNQGYSRIEAETWIAPEYSVYTDTFTDYNFDLVAAADLLTANGWIDSNGNGTRDKDGVEFEFDLYIPDGHEVRTDLALMFQSDLESIGVNANVVSTDWNSIIENGLKRGQLDAFTVGFLGGSRYVPDGYNFFHSRSIPTAYNRYSTQNAARWENTSNDSLMEAAKDELNIDVLRNIYAQQLALFNDEMPQLVHSHFGYLDASVPTVLNFSPNGTTTPATWNIEEWEQPDNPYDLSVRKALALDSPAPQPNTTITYEINVRNLGYFTITGATLRDEIQPDLVFVGADPAPTQNNWPVLTWDLGEIAGNSEYGVIKLAVHIPASYSHLMTITNVSEVYGDQVDTHPSNNGFIHVAEVREDIDLAINKSGLGAPAIGENFSYYLDYANWGGAPATNVVITDTLPPEVDFKSAIPAYSAKSGNTIT